MGLTMRLIVFTLVFAVYIADATVSASESSGPNIVFILADDMGYGDVRVNNPESKIPTPNLDRLAHEGMTFTDAHTPSAVCTPTRYGLLTGRYCWRSRLKRGVLNGYGEPLIEKDRPTVASFLKAHGYSTGIVGKWHLGLGFAKKRDSKGFDFSQPVTDSPKEHGFVFSHVIPASLDFPPYVYIENGTITKFPSIEETASKFPAFWRKGERAPNFVMEDCLDALLSQTKMFIESHAKSEKPFFLYFPLTAPHKPVLPHKRFRGKTNLGPYGDFVVQVDWTVGEVLKILDKTGIADNTLVIYTSDNGSFMYRYDDENQADHVKDETVQGYSASHHTSNHVFRGTKADIWEAGHHVPFFARWPGTIPTGSKCDSTICLTDFFATTASIIGAELDNGAAPDSFSLLELMKGKALKSPRAPVIHHSAAGMFSIREGKWKLVLGNGSGGRQQPRGKPFQKPYALFDMSKDLSERSNVINQHTDIAKQLEDKCLAIIEAGRSR